MSNQFVIGIDIGTSGCKTILVNDQGHVIAAKTVEYPLFTPQQGWTEQNPEDWWQASVTGVMAVLATSGVSAHAVRCVGLSGQMHGMVPLDEQGNVLRPAILWNDQRTSQQCQMITEAAGGKEGLLSLTNNLMLTGYTGGKIIWLRDHEPSLYEKTKMILNPKDYIRYRLTGDYVTEVSDASGTGLFDVKNRRWSEKLIRLLEIPIDMLPRCVESTEVTGTISDQVSKFTGLVKGTPVVGGGGDAVIQTTGMGLIQQGILGLTIGTSGNAAMGFSGYQENRDGLLQVFCNNEPHLWHVMGVTLTAGGAFQWYKNHFCMDEMEKAAKTGKDVYAILDAQAEESPAGSKNLLFLPYLNGERCPYPDPDAKATFVGLTLHHDKRDMTRSIMEGVTYSLRQVYQLMRLMDPKIAVSEIILSGGGSRSQIWRQICADIFQSPVKTVYGSAEGGAYGAAMVAGVGCHIWKNLSEAAGLLQVETITEPNPMVKETYDHLFTVYDSLYHDLKRAFQQLS